MQVKLSDLMLPAPVGGGFEMEGYWVWCGSVIKGEDGRYHMFASRWPKTYPMHPGWLLASEIVRASCDTPDGKYQFDEVVLPARGAQYWDGVMTHCPQITKVEGKYVLYYTGTTHHYEGEPDLSGEESLLKDPRVIALRANKRTGIAVSDSVFGPWKRFDKPLIDTREGEFDNFFISNSVPCMGPDGKTLLVYKTRTYEESPGQAKLECRVSHQVLGAAIVNSYDGDYTATRAPFALLSGNNLEDPFIWYDSDGYNLMAKDMTGELCGEPMGGIYANSKDGLNWTLKENFLFYSRNILWDDGVVREMGNLERPFLLIENGKPTHAFFATSDGKNGEGFCKCTKTWNAVIPLKV